LVSSNHLSNEEMWSYYNWIRDSVSVTSKDGLGGRTMTTVAAYRGHAQAKNAEKSMADEKRFTGLYYWARISARADPA